MVTNPQLFLGHAVHPLIQFCATEMQDYICFVVTDDNLYPLVRMIFCFDVKWKSFTFL